METIEKISFQSACKAEGLDVKTVIPDFSCYPKNDRKAMVAHAKIVIMVRAANRLGNGGKVWEPDFNNGDQWKYEIWWIKGSSGFRFHAYDFWYAVSRVGSRLCFISGEVARSMGRNKAFVKLINEYFL